MSHEAVETIDQFFKAACAGDAGRLSAIYAPDAVIWHNVDNTEKDVANSLGTLAWLADNIHDYRYEDVQADPIAGGVLRRHVCRGTIKSTGQEIEVPVAVVAQIEAGRITRLEEYFDSAQGAAGIE